MNKLITARGNTIFIFVLRKLSECFNHKKHNFAHLSFFKFSVKRFMRGANLSFPVFSSTDNFVPRVLSLPEV